METLKLCNFVIIINVFHMFPRSFGIRQVTPLDKIHPPDGWLFRNNAKLSTRN